MMMMLFQHTHTHTQVINVIWWTEIAHHKEQAASPISHVVQGAATSLGQRFVKNKQTDTGETRRCGTFRAIFLHRSLLFLFFFPPPLILAREREQSICSTFLKTQMPGPTQALSPNGENNNDIVPDNGSNIIPYRKNTVRGERAYR